MRLDNALAAFYPLIVCVGVGVGVCAHVPTCAHVWVYAAMSAHACFMINKSCARAPRLITFRRWYER